MKILGISAYYHDSAAALVVDGEIIAAAQEERFTRVKHDSGFPAHAVRFCLEQAKLKPADLDYVAFYDKPFLKFERLLETYLAFAPKGFESFRQALPLWIKEKLFQKDMLIRTLGDCLGKDVAWTDKLLFSEHHLSHAASAFFPSPFESAAILTMDGVGEWATTSLAVGRGNDISVLSEIHFPHSLGLLYSAFTYYTGFKVNSGEYKVMGLAPYGEPKYAAAIRENLIDIKEDGSFRLNLDYFDYCTGLRMTNSRFDALFGGPPRTSEARLGQREMDLAASIQVITEEVVLKLARSIVTTCDEDGDLAKLAGCRLLRPGHAYFANSYRLARSPKGWSVCLSDYGGWFVSAVRRSNVVGCQFHPELSGLWGSALWTNWLSLELAPVKNHARIGGIG